jgi:hypothetical protein
MVREEDMVGSQNFPEFARFIRSIQRIEGNADCFGKGDRSCERQDCAWRVYCQQETRKDSFDDNA